MVGRAAQLLEPFQVCPGHRAFTVHVCTQKTCAVRFELRHHAFRLKGYAAAPAVDGNSSLQRIQCNNDAFAAHFSIELLQKAQIHLSTVEDGATDDDLAGSPGGNFFGAGNGANPATHANFHCEFRSRLCAKRSHEFVVRTFTHNGVKIDDMKPRIPAEFSEKAKDVGNSKFALAAVHQLNGLAILQIDARDQHERRTSTPSAARNSFNVPIGWMR